MDNHKISLLLDKEEYSKYRLQNLSRDYGISFLEDGNEVVAVKINGDMEKPVMIEENEHLTHNHILKPKDSFAF